MYIYKNVAVYICMQLSTLFFETLYKFCLVRLELQRKPSH